MTPKLKSFLIPLLGILIFSLSSVAIAAVPDEQFDKGLQLLLKKDFPAKGQGISLIASSGDSRATTTLTTLLNGKLYRIKKDNTLVVASIHKSKAEIKSLKESTDLGIVKKRKLKKITINNTLRTKIKTALANINLSSSLPETRKNAALELATHMTPELTSLFTHHLQKEQNADVRETLLMAIALTDLASHDQNTKLQALDTLQGNLEPMVRNTLYKIMKTEQDPAIQQKIQTTLHSIETSISFYELIEKIFFGLSLGSVLVLAAIGLAITFGVIGVINMAHGELIMLGAYTTYVIQQLFPDSISMALILSIPAAFIVSGLTGIVVERTVIRFLYGRPLETLLATFGISLILQQAVRTIFSPLNRSVTSPTWMSGSLEVNPILSFTANRIVILLFAILVFTLLYLILKKSSLGLQVRAVSQNRSMARAMGIHASKIDALTFGLGSGIAGIAGVALSQLTNVGPNMGQAYIIDSFMVVVFGGVGNLFGTLISGLTLGIANKFLEPWAGAVLAKICILIFIILFIQKRPQGLFPQKGRSAG
jgi:urea transport system permease protein